MFSLGTALGCLWLLGLAGALALHLFLWRNFAWRVLRWNRPVADGRVTEVFEKVKGELGIRAALPLYENPRVDSPMIAGLFHPCVLLPASPLSAGEYEVVLRHELTHYRRGDLWLKLFLALSRCVHWFNPLIWAAAHAADEDIEIACDEAAVLGRDLEYRQRYCETILRLLRRSRRLPALSTGFNGGKNVLKKRFEAVMREKKRRGVILAALALALLAGGGMLVAIGTDRAPQPPSLPPAASAPAAELDPAEEAGSSPIKSDNLPLDPLPMDSQPLSQLETVQAGAADEYSLDLSSWTELYAWNETGEDNVLKRVAVYGKPQGVDTSYLTEYLRQTMAYGREDTRADIPQNVDRVVVEYVRYRPNGDSLSAQEYHEDAVIYLYDESEAGFGSFENAKLYSGDWWSYSLYNPDTGVTLCCPPAPHIAYAISNYGDGPFLESYRQYPAGSDRYDGRYRMLFYNAQWQELDGKASDYCYDVAFYDTQSNEVTAVARQIPNGGGLYPNFIDENAGLFLLYQNRNSEVHDGAASMQVYDPANPAEPLAVLDGSILPQLPQGATHWCVSSRFFVDDSYEDGPYALMVYPYIPERMPDSTNGKHMESGVNWYIVTLDKDFRVIEMFDTGLSVWGTAEYCSTPADVTLRDGLLYFDRYFNDAGVFQKERWVYHLIDDSHYRQLLETTMPASYYD